MGKKLLVFGVVATIAFFALAFALKVADPTLTQGTDAKTLLALVLGFVLGLGVVGIVIFER